MKRSPTRIVLAWLLGLGACDRSVNPNGGSDATAEVADGSGAAGDGSEGRSDGGRADGQRACNGPTPEDYSSLAMPGDAGLHYQGSNEETSELLNDALQPDDPECDFRAVHQRL